jgi:hypothetical protein
MTRRIRCAIGGAAGAIFSACQQYHYRLWRQWDSSKASICFITLSPSTADEMENDPAIERGQRRAIAWCFARLEVVNPFGLRSTDPDSLLQDEDPVGPGNDQAIIQSAVLAETGVCAWGQQKSGNHLNLRTTSWRICASLT